jgi:hypothetical protein
MSKKHSSRPKLPKGDDKTSAIFFSKGDDKTLGVASILV